MIVIPARAMRRQISLECHGVEGVRRFVVVAIFKVLRCVIALVVRVIHEGSDGNVW